MSLLQAFAVVRPEAADHFVGRDAAPHRVKDPDDVLEAPEEMVSPFESGFRLAAAGEEPGLPRRDRGQARDFVELALITDRVGRLRRRGDKHHVNRVVLD